MIIKKTNSVLWLALTTLFVWSGQQTVALAAENRGEHKENALIEFQSSDWSTPPIDPENPQNEVDTGEDIVKTEGELRLDFIPKFVFGPQKISDKDELYLVQAQLFKGETPARANYVQITDNRGELTGWELTVKQETPFNSSKDKSKELKGAILSLDKQWANSITSKELSPTIMKDAIKISEVGTSYPVAKADMGKGGGTWVIEFGSSGSIEDIENTLEPIKNADGKPLTNPSYDNKPMYQNSAIKLSVPGKTKKEPIKYSTVITWTISELT